MKVGATISAPVAQRGIALILVLWVLVLLTIIAGSFAYSVHTSTQMAANAIETAKARELADGGVMKGVFELLSAQNLPTAWKANGQTHRMQIEGHDIAVTLTDESGKIDLNGAPPALLTSLLQSVGVDADRAAQLALTIVSWRAPQPAGAGLQPQLGAVAAHGPFRNIEALQQVPGITPQLFRRLAPLVTVFTGLPGVNTMLAPESVLRALPGVSPELANAYAQQRAALWQGGQAVPPLTQAGSYNVAALSGFVGVLAQVSLSDGAGYAREAVVRITGQPGHPYQILSWREAYPPTSEAQADSSG
ncbi:MAG: type II secretion system protein GspK [Thiomonas sp.]|uniref:general secretion pathway protein GspK n=1 Tax=Thiomonas sp. TaxID=2047785 RepID=UPI002A359C92|nr:type II secretion system protein GspK [Thiomonas sp.]MDY0330449.1 type II secretion system protein GspK [Thiomonas sp.]